MRHFTVCESALNKILGGTEAHKMLPDPASPQPSCGPLGAQPAALRKGLPPSPTLPTFSHTSRLSQHRAAVHGHTRHFLFSPRDLDSLFTNPISLLNGCSRKFQPPGHDTDQQSGREVPVEAPEAPRLPVPTSQPPAASPEPGVKQPGGCEPPTLVSRQVRPRLRGIMIKAQTPEPHGGFKSQLFHLLAQ